MQHRYHRQVDTHQLPDFTTPGARGIYHVFARDVSPVGTDAPFVSVTGDTRNFGLPMDCRASLTCTVCKRMSGLTRVNVAVEWFVNSADKVGGIDQWIDVFQFSRA